MDPYKPQYLGKIMPAETPKLKEFMVEQYDQFNTVYDICKASSDAIDDVANVGNDGDDLTVKVMTDNGTMEKLGEAAANDDTVTVRDNLITVAPSTPA